MELNRLAAIATLSAYVVLVPYTLAWSKWVPAKLQPPRSIPTMNNEKPKGYQDTSADILVANSDSASPTEFPQTPPPQLAPQSTPVVAISKSPAPKSPKTAAAKSPSSALAVSPNVQDKPIGNSAVIGPYTQNDLYWLAKMVYAEAAAEPYDGQVAVAAVILHRVANPDYPNTIKAVEYQVVEGHYQFTPVLNGYINQVEPNNTSYQAAKDALAGVDPSKGAMLYYNPLTSTNKWILSRPITLVIGNHTFAK